MRVQYAHRGSKQVSGEIMQINTKTAAQVLARKARPLVSIAPDASVFDALTLMAKHDIGSLVVLDGEAEVLIANAPDDPAPRVERLRRGDFAYYPSFQHHTIRCPGPGGGFQYPGPGRSDDRRESCRHLPFLGSRR